MTLTHRLGTTALYIGILSTSQKGAMYLFAAQEKNPARNAMDMHVQDFVVNEDLLLPILKRLMFLV